MMLQKIRDGAKSKVAWIFIGALLFVFALSGSEALFTSLSGGANRVATVNGEQITRLEFDRQVASMRNQMGERYTEDDEPRLREAAREQLIQQRVLTTTARSSGMTISDRTLNEFIVEMPQFAVDGVFNRNVFQALLRDFNYTPSTFRVALADDLLANQYRQSLIGSSFVTSLELEQLLALDGQSRDFSYAVISADSVRDKVAVSEEDIAYYYDRNPSRFTVPEQVALDYIDLRVSELMEDVEVEENLVREQYEANIAAYVATTERRAAHIQFNDPNDPAIVEVQERLAAGEDFAELAGEYSQDTGSRAFGGELGYTSGDTFPEPFEAALAQLEAGQVSDPVRTGDGVHLIKLLEVRVSEPPSFEQERERIVAQIARAEAEYLFVGLLDQLQEVSHMADDLGEVAEQLGLPLRNTGLFSRDTATGLAANPRVLREAFSEPILESGQTSYPIELGNDRVVVIKKSERRAAYLSDLETVREEIVDILSERQARELLAAEGADLADRAREMGLAAAAEDAGLELNFAEAAARVDTEHNRDAVQLAFSLPRPEARGVVGSRHTQRGDYLVLELSAVNEPDIAENYTAEERNAILAQLVRLTGEVEYERVEELLMDQARIRRR